MTGARPQPIRSRAFALDLAQRLCRADGDGKALLIGHDLGVWDETRLVATILSKH